MCSSYKKAFFSNKPCFKLIYRRRKIRKPFPFRGFSVGQSTSKLAHSKFGLVSKKINLDGFLRNFKSLAGRAKKHQAIKHLMYLKTYRGLRHELWLPVRGQSSRTNAKTRRKRGIQ